MQVFSSQRRIPVKRKRAQSGWFGAIFLSKDLLGPLICLESVVFLSSVLTCSEYFDLDGRVFILVLWLKIDVFDRDLVAEQLELTLLVHFEALLGHAVNGSGIDTQLLVVIQVEHHEDEV